MFAWHLSSERRYYCHVCEALQEETSNCLRFYVHKKETISSRVQVVGSNIFMIHYGGNFVIRKYNFFRKMNILTLHKLTHICHIRFVQKNKIRDGYIKV
jgi:hypothetical protein